MGSGRRKGHQLQWGPGAYAMCRAKASAGNIQMKMQSLFPKNWWSGKDGEPGTEEARPEVKTHMTCRFAGVRASACNARHGGHALMVDKGLKCLMT